MTLDSRRLIGLQRLRRLLTPRYRLTLFGRSLALFLAEILANGIMWAAALATFAPKESTRGVLSLCLIAWTLGLRHGLDMDHLVAIDNVCGQSLESVHLLYRPAHFGPLSSLSGFNQPKLIACLALLQVTRNLVFMGKLPVTVGLFFSLGHSSIVVAATIAIVVAVSAIDNLSDVGAVGGLIGELPCSGAEEEYAESAAQT